MKHLWFRLKKIQEKKKQQKKKQEAELGLKLASQHGDKGPKDIFDKTEDEDILF